MNMRITEKTTIKEALEMMRNICDNYPEGSSMYKNARAGFAVFVANQNLKAVGGK